MQTDSWERIVQQTSRRYRWRTWHRGIAARRLGDRQILDADTPRRVGLRLQRLNLDRAAAVTILREGPGPSVPYSPVSRTAEDPVVLERILGQNEFMPISFLQRGAIVAESVGRITIQRSDGQSGFGSGFLVGPGLLLTNNHVLDSPEVASKSFVEFNYERLSDGHLDQVLRFKFAPGDLFLTDRNLDFTLLAVQDGGGTLQRFGWNRLMAQEGKVILGERLNIIQHPEGEYKQLALRENRLVDVLEDFLHYHTDTSPGSSGAPVFNDQWEVVALHHAGVPKRDGEGRIMTRDGHVWKRWMGEHRIMWIANEGVRVSRIVTEISAASLRGEADRLRKAMFLSESPLPASSLSTEGGCSNRNHVLRPLGPDANNRVATWEIPLTVSVRVGEPRGIRQADPAPSILTPSVTATNLADPLLATSPLENDIIVTTQMIRRMRNSSEAREFEKELDDMIRSADGAETTFKKELGANLGAFVQFAKEWKGAIQLLEDVSQDVDDDVLYAPRNRLAALMQSLLAERLAPTGSHEITQRNSIDVHELKFSKNDWWGWIKSLFSWVNESDFHEMLRPATARPEPLPDRARLAVFSDWGTALYGAPHIADAIRNTGGFDVVMHLGDVYYAGTEKEMRKRFLDVWPFGAGTLNRGLNSNHDMYSGGHGYFDLVLPQFDQESSYFAMQNQNWVLVCLDTAYRDFDIDSEQVNWIKDVLEQAEKRKVVFFSHHQLFSQFEDQGKKLAKRLKSILESERVDYWFWGHEHRCVVYDAHETLGLRGRCVGHGGIPEKRKGAMDSSIGHSTGQYKWMRLTGTNGVPNSLTLDGPNVHILGKEDNYLPHGYVTLEFSGENLEEVYMSSLGEELLRIQC